MTTLRVPQDYPTVQAAVDASMSGDVINVSDSYSATETVSVATDNLFFRGISPAAVTLDLGAVTTVHVSGSLPFSIVGGGNGASIHARNAAPNTVTGSDVADSIYIGPGDTVVAGGGDDLIDVAGMPAFIDGGAGKDIVRISGNTSFAAGSVTNVEAFRVLNGASTSLAALTSPLTIFSSSSAGGSVTARGGAGNDIFYDGAGADRFVGNGGVDTYSYRESAAGVTANLGDSSVNTGSAAGDTYAGVENLTGSNFDDVLYGDRFANVLAGGYGDDTIYGGAGDTLIGGNPGSKNNGGTDTFVVNGSAWGLPGVIDGGSYPTDEEIHVVGDTTFAAEDSVSGISNVVVDNGVTADFSKLDRFGPRSSYRSLSTIGGGSTIVGSASFTNRTYAVKFYGGDGADTLIGGQAGSNVFYLKATPKSVIGDLGGSSIYILNNSVSITPENIQRIDSFFLRGGVVLDLSGYNPERRAGSYITGVFVEPDYADLNPAAYNVAGTSFDDLIDANRSGGVLAGGKGVDELTGSGQGGGETDFVFHAGDTGIASAAALDAVSRFTSGQDKIRIDGIASNPATYAETAITSGTYDDAAAAAASLMADGTKDVVFVAGGAGHNGYLFWNAQATHNSPDQAVMLFGAGALTAFDSGDLAAPLSANAQAGSDHAALSQALFNAAFDHGGTAPSQDAALQPKGLTNLVASQGEGEGHAQQA